ncbi:hypothetical protein BP6252_02556 [Coleophoma cylindrospora]|uniref:Autophagy-related protein 33 n=1 Tax=Coleophoma cylindrospora TaxID=1849047 RepID=A0A3D8SFA4_9HELO|nr:hypothetical protein BP6252_02556 [Coleophoma cylindrospora]
MASRTVSTLKFVGSISLGLLTGLSYTLSTLTLPTLLTLPSASNASRAFTNLTTLSLTHLRTLAGLSSSSFLLAYFLSPRSQKHPYLLWTTILVGLAGTSDLFLPASTRQKSITLPKQQRAKTSKNSRHMEASYEVLGDSNSEGTVSGEEMDDEVNGEEVKVALEGFLVNQAVKTIIAGIGFAMSVVGIWGDGVADGVVIIEM